MKVGDKCYCGNNLCKIVGVVTAPGFHYVGELCGKGELDPTLREALIIANGLWLRRGFDDDHPMIKELAKRLKVLNEKVK